LNIWQEGITKFGTWHKPGGKYNKDRRVDISDVGRKLFIKREGIGHR